LLTNKTLSGVNLIELLAVLALVGILTAIAIPTFFRYLQMNNISENAQKLYFNLQYAKSEAMKRNTTVFVVFQTGTNWCYGMNAGATCSCNTANSCGLGAVSATNADFSNLSLTSITGNAFTFEGTRGATYLNKGVVTFTLTNSTTAISIQISTFGNLLICSANVSGYSACS
jgi:prepilin-type N-terminal cleavage/methylation domain-containing protein